MRRYSFKKPYWKILIGVLDRFGDLLVGNRLKNASLPARIQKILLIRLDHIGDGILLTPLVRKLRTAFPQAKISAIFSSEVAQVFEGLPGLDKVWVLKKHWFSRDFLFLFSGEIFRLLLELRREQFDLGLDPRGDLRNILFLSAAKARFRIGYGSSGGGSLLHRELEESYGEHEVERDLKVLAPLGFSTDGKKDNPEIKAGEIHSDAPRGTYAVIHAGAGTSAKQWPLDRWKVLVDLLLSQGLTVALVGKGENENRLAEFFKTESRVWNGVGRLTLPETWAVIQRAQLFIGADSGLAHGAGALNVKTLVLESGTNRPERWGVRGSRVQRIHFPVFCAPCHLTRCRFASHDCMEGITVEQVKEAVQEFLVSA